MGRRKACWLLPLVLCPLAGGGCGGQYIMTVPDQLARAGGETTTVVRLQRNDFFVLAPPVKEAAMRFRIAGGLERGAYTDKLGYAATTVPAPERPGRYTMTVSHMDDYGDEAVTEGQVYVWDPNRPVIAVDMDCLPGMRLGSSKEAARALRRLVVGADLLYLTRRSAGRHAKAHETLTKAGYPRGPILAWRRQRWHIVRDGRFKLPRIVVESRLVSQLPEVRRMFPKLSTGVCDSALAARAYAAAGMKVVMVGTAPADINAAIRRRNSWADLADKGP